MLDPTIQKNKTIRYPVPQDAMMNLRKSPMDMNTNRYEKLVQVPSRGAERASSDDATIEQCQSAYQQSTKTTVTEVDTNFAGKPKPTQNQGIGCGGRGGRNRRCYECTVSVDRL